MTEEASGTLSVSGGCGLETPLIQMGPRAEQHHHLGPALPARSEGVVGEGERVQLKETRRLASSKVTAETSVTLHWQLSASETCATAVFYAASHHCSLLLCNDTASASCVLGRGIFMKGREAARRI